MRSSSLPALAKLNSFCILFKDVWSPDFLTAKLLANSLPYRTLSWILSNHCEAAGDL